MKLAVLHMLIAATLASGVPRQSAAEFMYYPEYAGPDGGIVEFNKVGFRLTYFDDQGDYSFMCKKLSSMTTSLHWAQCEGGKKFLFTLDPKHPETMKIGDVVYKACGKQWENCR